MAAEGQEPETDTVQLDFHFLKTPGYRTYYVDGAWGGFTPRGMLYMELFVERNATPQLVRYEISKRDDETQTARELLRDGKTGIIREIECGLMLDVRTAKVVRDWLSEKLSEYTRVTGEDES